MSERLKIITQRNRREIKTGLRVIMRIDVRLLDWRLNLKQFFLPLKGTVDNPKYRRLPSIEGAVSTNAESGNVDPMTTRLWALAMIALPAIALAGCERTVAEIRGTDPREEIEIAMPRIEAANCVLREYESQPRTAWSSTWPLTPRDFPSENLTELVSVHGIVINAMVDIKGLDKGSVAIVYRPSNVLPQTTNDRLVAAARSCQSRARSATSR